MNLLLFSDLHCDIAAARRLVALAEKADVLVGAGDFGNARRRVEVCLDILREVGKPTVLVPGNNESLDELTAACHGWEDAHVLHGSSVTLEGVEFFGIGGGIPVTPFGSWSYDFTEEEAEDLLSACPEECVLVSHSPPKGVLDVSSRGKSLGSTAVRDCVSRTTPRLVVCGHIHACGGQSDVLGETPVVNAGPAGVAWRLS